MAFVSVATLLPHFHQDDGPLLAGGTLELYQAGTTTRAQFFTAAGVALGTTSILDARGEPTADLFVVSGESYKFRLLDADGVLIREWDDILVGNRIITVDALSNADVTIVTTADSPKTLALADEGTVIVDVSGGSITINLPTASGNKNLSYIFARADGSANTVTIDGNSTETIDGAATVSLDNNQWWQIVADGSSNWYQLRLQAVSVVYSNAVSGLSATDVQAAIDELESLIGTGGGGVAIILDLGDDGVNESSALTEIATANDTNIIFSEPTADKLLIDVSKNWPSADTVAALTGLTTDNLTEGTTNLYFSSTLTQDLNVNSQDLINIKTATFAGEVDDGNSSTDDTINWTTGLKHKSTLTGNVTYTFTDPPGPCNLMLKLVQDATGSRTATWPASVKWPGGTAPTLSTAAGAVDLVSFYFDGVNYYAQAGLNFS